MGSELEQQYLDAALRVMKKHDVKIDELHQLIKPLLAKYALAENDAHYNKAGYQIPGTQVAQKIGAASQPGAPRSANVPGTDSRHR